MPGPIPRPESTLARPRSRKGSDEQAVTTGLRQAVTWELPADTDWHPIAQHLYNAVATSGQADFYQNSDWAILYSLCEDISYYKKESKMAIVDKKTGEVREYPKPRSGQMLQAIMSNLTSLLLTEGERRRVRLELQDRQHDHRRRERHRIHGLRRQQADDDPEHHDHAESRRRVRPDHRETARGSGGFGSTGHSA